MSAKDDNGFPVIYGVSHLDGVTPVRIWFNLLSRRMLTDEVTAIAFNPAIVTNQNPTMYPFAKGTSTADDATCLPWVVHATTHAVLVDRTP